MQRSIQQGDNIVILLVRTFMEYASVICDRSRRIILGTWTFCSVCQHNYRTTNSETPMLQQLFQEFRAWKRRACIVASFTTLRIYTKLHDTNRISGGHHLIFLVALARAHEHQTSFFTDTIRIWNSL